MKISCARAIKWEIYKERNGDKEIEKWKKIRRKSRAFTPIMKKKRIEIFFVFFPQHFTFCVFFLSIHLNSFFLLFLKRSFTFCTKPPDKSYLSRHTDNFTVSKTITKWTNESKTVRHLKVIYQSHKIIKWVFNLKNKTNTFFVNNLYITWLWNYFI